MQKSFEYSKPIITRVVERAEQYVKHEKMKYQEAVERAEKEIFDEDMKAKG